MLAAHPTLIAFPCCIEASDAYLPKAQYALRMLLLPLGLEPVWVGRDALDEKGLYYGPYAAHIEKAVAISLDAETEGFFASKAAYQPDCVQWVEWESEQWPVLFGDAKAGRGDGIASAFFWLSGWQEQTTNQRDRHGRFPHATSLQDLWGTTTRPAVDAYREWLAEDLEARDIPVFRRKWDGADWALCPTHDIDYLKKWRKGMIYRETVEYLIRNFRQESLARRIRRFGAFLRDWLRPGDRYRLAFERMQREVEQRGGTATYFLKMGAHGEHDTYYDPADRYLATRIAALKESGFEVGLHPSYYAHNHAFYMHEEREELAALLDTDPVSVRQHYLRYEWPTTPRLHEKNGFQIDSSLGFAECAGFRHATCHPFQLFDLAANRALAVWEVPLAVMESAIFNRENHTLEEACVATNAIMATCERFGGVAVMLWHNVLWDEMDHPGWGAHFLETLDAAIEKGARMSSICNLFSSS